MDKNFTKSEAYRILLGLFRQTSGNAQVLCLADVDSTGYVFTILGTTEKLTLKLLPSASIEQGDLLYLDSNGDWVALHHGDLGKFLKSGGHGADPSWDTALSSLDISATPGTDLTVTGGTVTLQAGEAVAFGDVCMMASSGKMMIAKADAVANSWGLFLCTETISLDGSGKFLLPGGFARKDAWAWTVGGAIFLSATGTTTNTLTQSAPAGSGNVVQVLGIATHADRIFFSPQLVLVEHV